MNISDKSFRANYEAHIDKAIHDCEVKISKKNDLILMLKCLPNFLEPKFGKKEYDIYVHGLKEFENRTKKQKQIIDDFIKSVYPDLKEEDINKKWKIFRQFENKSRFYKEIDKFLHHKKELLSKNAEVNNLTVKFQTKEEENKKLKEEMKLKDTSISLLKNKDEQSKTQISVLKDQLERVKKELSNSRMSYKDLQKEKEFSDLQKEDLKQQLQDSRDNNKELRESNRSLRESVSELSKRKTYWG
tara:strand:+ start:745 stop:1476 length:732 start_codon:yes stop_codon:yes gene_type:complete